MSGSTYTIANGYDVYCLSLSPATNYAGSPYVATTNTIATEYAYVYLPLPGNIANQTIASATLTGHSSASTSATTATVKRVTSSWSEATLSYGRQPTVAGTAYNTSVPAASPGDAINLDVTAIVQSAVNGSAYYGFQLSSTTLLEYWSFDSGNPTWTLTVVTTDAPEVPQTLVPNGTVVGSGAPVLTCDFTDNGGLTNDMAAMQVQISTTTSFTSPVYNQTGTTTVPVFDLANPPPGATAFSAISSGSTRYWRVQVQDSDGNWSGFSDPASFTFRTKQTISLSSPASGVLWDPVSDIIATTSTNLSAYRVQITSATDRTAIRYDSGRLPANPGALTTIDVTLPQEYLGSRVLVDNSTYQLHVQAWDTYSRQSTPGVPSYTESWSTFAFSEDAAVTAPASLAAVQSTAGPGVTLTWTRSSAPVAWVILRDSKIVDRIDGPGAFVSGTTYTYTDDHPVPWVTHTYNVRAIASTGHRSQNSNTVSFAPGLKGVWLRTQDGQQVVLDGTGVDQLVVTDRRTTYKPINVRYDVDIVTGFEGLSGTFTGTVSNSIDPTQSVAAAQAVLLSIKESPSQWVRLVYGGFSGKVLLRNVSVTPSPLSTPVAPVLAVSFGVNHIGRYDDVI